MLKRKSGVHNLQYFRKKVSTVFINGAACNIDTNGFLIPATATSLNHVGVILIAVAATDADYAVATMVPVDLARTTDMFIADVSAGTIAQTVIGDFFDFNSTGDKVNLSSSTIRQVFVTEIMAASSQVVVLINSTAGADESGT